MKLLDWYKDVKAVLEANPEEWLAYLPGQTIGKYKPILSKPTKYQGVFLQTLIFFWHLVGFSKPSKNKLKDINKNSIWIYASSQNQLVSLEKVAESLKNKHGKTVVTLTLNKHISDKGFTLVRLNTMDVFKIIVIFLTRYLSLLTRLKKNNELGVKYFFGVFLSSYIYLIAFQRMLVTNKPKLILISNDHNVDCRSLIFMAKRLGIKTAYLQHASVSEVFPALSMDYAFLDGQAAEDIYRECEENSNNKQVQPKEGIVPEEAIKIYHTGQQKNVKVSTLNRKKVGIAVNAVDTLKRVIEVVELLAVEKEEIIIRWHPRQSTSDIQKMLNEFKDSKQVIFSDPNKLPVLDFLKECKTVIAGNSSILLEAALSGASPVYYRFDEEGMEDYYGFCKKGLARDAKDIIQLKQYIGDAKLTPKQIEAVKYYSATFETEWEGKEFELVGDLLVKFI